MSRRGDNIRKRKDGRWEGRYIVAHNSVGRAIYHSVYGRTYSEVREKLTNASIIAKPAVSTSNNTILNDVASDWLTDIKSYRKYSTYVKYEYIYNNHIKEHLGNKYIENIEPQDCIRMIEHECFEKDSKLSQSTFNSIRNVIMQIMKYGNNPIEFTIDTYKVRQSYSSYNENLKVFSNDEQIKLRNYLLENTDSYKLGIYVCMFTGLRLGEICALKTENIDLVHKVISVTQSAQRIKSEKENCKTELIMSTPKTSNSVRIVPICDVLLSALKMHMSDNEFLVNGSELMEPRTYQYWFQRILLELSIGEKNFHSLRHTFATNCISNGMDPKCLSEILGHSDVKTTLNKYVHPSLEQKIKQLNSCF